MSGAAAGPSTPTPTPATTTTTAATTQPGGQRPPDSEIGPGIVGFAATFAIAVALVLLVRDMNRRVQRLRYRAATAPDEPGGERGPAG